MNRGLISRSHNGTSELHTRHRAADAEKYADILRWYVSFTEQAMSACHIFHPTTQTFYLVATSGLQTSFRAALSTVDATALGLGQVLRTEAHVFVAETAKDSIWQPYRMISDLCSIRAAYFVPMTYNGQFIGVMSSFFSHRPTEKEQTKLLKTHTEAAAIVAPLLAHAVKTQPDITLFHHEHAQDTQPWFNTPNRPDVQAAWERCREYFGDNPSPPMPTILPEEALQKKRQENLTMLTATQQHLSMLFYQRRDLDCAVLLCDAEGWLLEITGSLPQVKHLEAQGIVPGRNVSEPHIGNTALGSALFSRQPVFFHGHEHYFHAHRMWSTAGAPILLGGGQHCIGSFAFASMTPHVATYMPALAHATSIAIGNWVELEEYRQDTVRVHQSLLSQLDYHVISLDAERNVVEERHPISLGPDVVNSMRAITRQGECSDSELVMDGRTYLVDVRHLYSHAGELKGTLGLFRDISQRKEYEARLREVEKLSMLTALTAGIAHEIRNPLTTARGFLQLFTERLSAPSDKQFLALTIAELDRIQSLVQDFMGLAKPESAHYGFLDLTDTLLHVAQFLHPEAAMHNIPFDVQLDAQPRIVWGDESQIKQVLMNVLQNAMHACIEVRGRAAGVQLSVENTEHAVRVIVEDTGVGIAVDAQDKVFRPFYTTKEAGTGLGLSICKRIIEEHGGNIELTSELERGTTVQISLPLRTSEVW